MVSPGVRKRQVSSTDYVSDIVPAAGEMTGHGTKPPPSEDSARQRQANSVMASRGEGHGTKRSRTRHERESLVRGTLRSDMSRET